MNAQEVADYLREHPEFFDEHAALFAQLTVPHPHGGRAIPLAERQMITLREKNRMLELKVAELMRFGQENDAIAERLARWTRLLLLQRSVRLLPETLIGSLEEIFSMPYVAMVLWEVADEFAVEGRAADATPELIAFVERLADPYCGPLHGESVVVLPLFSQAKDMVEARELATANGAASEGASDDADREQPEVRSVALIPLRRGAAPAAFGLLALGSADARRFHEGMATDFLARIGETTSAALTRLLR
jgi:uncharacterized protein YigA (DUF484 family)